MRSFRLRPSSEALLRARAPGAKKAPYALALAPLKPRVARAKGTLLEISDDETYESREIFGLGGGYNAIDLPAVACFQGEKKPRPLSRVVKFPREYAFSSDTLQVDESIV